MILSEAKGRLGQLAVLSIEWQESFRITELGLGLITNKDGVEPKKSCSSKTRVARGSADIVF